VIDQPIKLVDSPSRVMMGPAPDGLPAVTRFRVVERFAAHALCEAHPETGRQHQIRVHFASLGHPLVGDKLYGGGEELFMRSCDEGMSPEMLQAVGGLPRHALHAHRLTFQHPMTRAELTVESPLAPDLVAFIEGLRARAA
jgi:23S rRNA pseudouridine1911/1915/1917 synthase